MVGMSRYAGVWAYKKGYYGRFKTSTFGVTTGGTAFNDLNVIGGVQNVNRISRIVIRHGEIVDAITTTYQRSRGLSPITRSNGGTGGNLATVDLSATESVITITGTFRSVSAQYGPSSVQNLNFVILNSSTGAVRVAGPFAPASGGTPFRVYGTLVAFAGTISTRGTRFIQALSFFIIPTRAAVQPDIAAATTDDITDDAADDITAPA
ncbi:unnamed protein product [Somion occarium]|uniref:Jacalin-type lectin domain-containing protein n=1 Tax=Somion occarium TaxID=3059160 RepID=A0ABP1DH91_9APHY